MNQKAMTKHRVLLEATARRLIRTLRPRTPPTTFEVLVVAEELALWKRGITNRDAGARVTARMARQAPKAPKAQGLRAGDLLLFQAAAARRR